MGARETGGGSSAGAYGAAAAMVAAAAVPGERGRAELAHALREEGERGEGALELAGWV